MNLWTRPSRKEPGARTKWAPRLLETASGNIETGYQPEPGRAPRFIRPLGAGCERCRCCRISSALSALRLRAEPLSSGSSAHRRSHKREQSACGGRNPERDRSGFRQNPRRSRPHPLGWIAPNRAVGVLNR
jgi:hypothetical protein